MTRDLVQCRVTFDVGKFSFHIGLSSFPCFILFNLFFSFFFSKAIVKNGTVDGIEAEYIKNLQQQIYFLELETNYLYPFDKSRNFL